MNDLDRLRSVDETVAGEIIGHKRKTLQNWRLLRRGPPYMKCGRSIRYRIGDLLDWQSAGRVDPEATR